MTNAGSPGFWEVVQYLASFTLVIALLMGFLVLLKRLQYGTVFKPRGQRLQILESLSVGTRQRLILVRLDQQELLLGVGANEIQQLSTQPLTQPLTQPASQADATTQASAAVAAPERSINSLDLLQRWRRKQ